MKGAGLVPRDLGGILVGSGSSPRAFPGVSADLQRLLPAPGIPAFDIPLASVGGLFALAVAADMTGRLGPILVVGAEVMSRVLKRPPRIKETAILFGDGAGATVVSTSVSDAAARPEALAPSLSILDSRIASDGTYAEDLALDAEGPLRMNGRSVILQANRKLQGVVAEILARNGLEPAQIDRFIFHQANRNLLRQVAGALRIDEGRVFMNLERYGNTSAASVLIALADSIEERPPGVGERIVLAAFGAGFGWGAVLLQAV